MNIKRITLQLLCLLLLLWNFTSVAHGITTILDEQFRIDMYNLAVAYPFDLPAGDNITIYIQVQGGAIDFHIDRGPVQVYVAPAIQALNDTWTVPAEDSYTFMYELLDVGSEVNVHTILGSEIIPEFPIWTSMLLILITLTTAIVIYKRRLLKTPVH